MLEQLKLLLGDAAQAFSDARLELALELAQGEVEAYCNRRLDDELRAVALRIAVVNLNRQNTEGLSGQAFSGVNENYINGYPADIMMVLNRRRKVKLL